jgi:hypothetical protein
VTSIKNQWLAFRRQLIEIFVLISEVASFAKIIFRRRYPTKVLDPIIDSIMVHVIDLWQVIGIRNELNGNQSMHLLVLPIQFYGRISMG